MAVLIYTHSSGVVLLSANSCWLLFLGEGHPPKSKKKSLEFVVEPLWHSLRSQTSFLFFAILIPFNYPFLLSFPFLSFPRYEKESGEIDYNAFLSGINWRENPTPPVLPEDVLKVRQGFFKKQISKLPVYRYAFFLKNKTKKTYWTPKSTQPIWGCAKGETWFL